MNNNKIILGVNAEQLLKYNPTIIVGLSLGNPAFTLESIQKMFNTAYELTGSVTVMIPDEPSTHTYRAAGYEGKKLERKVNRAIKQLKAKVTDDWTIETWQGGIAANEHYKESLNEITELYEKNTDFRAAVREITQGVVENKLRFRGKDKYIENNSYMEQAVNEGVKFLQKELGYIQATPKMHGPSIYSYSNEWPILEKLISGEYDGKRRDNLGFMQMFLNSNT